MPISNPPASGAPGSVSDPIEQSYAPGSFDVATGDYVIMANNLTLAGVESVTLEGTSALVIV